MVNTSNVNSNVPIETPKVNPTVGASAVNSVLVGEVPVALATVASATPTINSFVRNMPDPVMSQYMSQGNVPMANPYMNSERMANPRVFLDLNIGSHPVSRLVIELFADSTLITVENFRAICTSEKGISKNGKPLHYMGTTFHRMIPGCMFNGRDFTEGNRLGGESIYGDSFTNENNVNKHTGFGILSMANTSPGTNGSQFSYVPPKPSGSTTRTSSSFRSLRDLTL
ncbi:hypothetical protein EZV62_004925 [Acer yangbiense]|uniref:Peptidyl-prolyl cis-trans isomerase n=1 Tax=Acer yangbiense TaxID=1000413 RepID=A0A5C7ILG5_9ROSI|nr:hypothetical protein EZV62_004925 [Acer yangbiense]